MRATLFVLPGALFGAGLAVSGMVDPAKVVGFLDLAGAWDPSLAFVMVGAMASFWFLTRLLRGRTAPFLGGSFPPPPSGSPDRRLLLGSALFGIGWGRAGLCPGPAITNLAHLELPILAFVGAMLAGMFAAQRLFGADR
ncbi:MAG: YeeE/YedE family protein [Planctomycetaceae bacterium]|nr:YeeE/YedE family protein [Planctomycetaceae bacterium]